MPGATASYGGGHGPETEVTERNPLNIEKQFGKGAIMRLGDNVRT